VTTVEEGWKSIKLFLEDLASVDVQAADQVKVIFKGLFPGGAAWGVAWVDSVLSIS
jgi:hypothetical protein